MRFPLHDWIEAHPGCRFDLASSGMRGSIPAPRWPGRRVDAGAIAELRAELALHLEVDPSRLFLSHGASEANGWVLGHLARQRRLRAPRLRVRYPEYPPLFDVGRRFGFVVQSDRRPAAAAVVSRPRNPEGSLWSERELDAWATGADQRLVDETFREFAGVPSLARHGTAGLWTTGSFTKFFGADDVRVGFAVAPPEAVSDFERHVGLVSDEIAPASAAMALDLLRRIDAVRRSVDRVVRRNLRALRTLLPGLAGPAAPLVFDRPPGGDGDRLAERCANGSVLVCPGSLFGRPEGVRLCLTRREAPRALAEYVRLRRPNGRTP